MHLVPLLYYAAFMMYSFKHMHKHRHAHTQHTQLVYKCKPTHINTKTHRICTQTHIQAQTHTHVCTLVECRKVFGPFTQVCHFQDTLDNISNQAHIIWPLLPLIKRPDKFIVNQNAWNQWPWYVHQAGKGVDLRVPHQNAIALPWLQSVHPHKGIVSTTYGMGKISIPNTSNLKSGLDSCPPPPLEIYQALHHSHPARLAPPYFLKP